MIDPRYLTVEQWTDAVNLTLATLAPTTRLQAGDWQQWACNVIAAPAVARFAPPNPKSFARWSEWAERFVQCVPL